MESAWHLMALYMVRAIIFSRLLVESVNRKDQVAGGWDKDCDN